VFWVTSSVPTPEISLRNWLQSSARHRPRTVALEFNREQRTDLTYQQLAAASNALAVDIDPAQRRSLPGHDPLEFAQQLHAALQAGAVVMPIDPRLRADEINLRERTAFDPPPGAATLMFTSGTTSLPRPVYLTERNWEANAIGSALALGLDPHERWLCTMPLAHVGGLSILLRSTLYGTTVVLHDGFNTERVLADLTSAERRITLVSLVPTMLARLLDAGFEHPPALRWVLLGGGPISPALLQRAEQAGVPVAPTYGMTETCSQLATFGRPLYGNEFRFEGGDSSDEGEIVVRGPSVAPLSADADGWLRTGDLGSLDDHNRLVIAGRKSDTIISGGENIAPNEVEAALAEHPAVEEAGVYAIPDPQWGEAVAAKVVLRAAAANGNQGADSAAIAAELQAFVRARLAAFKVPKQITFTDVLPRTSSGKLLRREL
jgi:o-succinylbenzoate---CoA ligase